MRETVQPFPTSEQWAERWIPEGVQTALDSDVYQIMDELFGVGERHEFGQIGECALSLYPEHQAIEYENLELYLVIKKPSRLTIARGGVYIDTPGQSQTSFLAVDLDGGLSIVVKPRQLELDRLRDGDASAEAGRQAAPAAGSTPDAVSEPITQAPTDSLISETPAPWEEEEQASPDEPPAVSQKEKKARRDFNGRLGRPPICRTTPRGKVITKFPVAEHSKDEEGADKTNWSTVMAFNALAERLCGQVEAGELKVGDEVKVAGYPQITMVPDGRGGMKEQEVLFAAHVSKPKQKGGDR